MLFSTINVYASTTQDDTSLENSFISESKPEIVQLEREDSEIHIIDPEAGYLYLFQVNPIRMPIASALGLNYAIIVNRNLHIETTTQEIHHVKFIAQRLFTGWETVRWDYNRIDGLSLDMDLATGFYDLKAYAYDEGDQELDTDSLRVLFIKVGRDDFGVWVNSKYDNGQTISTPLDIGLTEFSSMLNTGEPKYLPITLQSKDDTEVELGFKRTKIMGSTENVIETKFNVDTSCDTAKDYEVELEVRFPFILLDGGTINPTQNPYFSAKVGYISDSEVSSGEKKVDMTFYFGRESLDDPRVFRMELTPEHIDSSSHLTLFNSYLAIDGEGNEVFQRRFSVDFAPATELTITSIPSQAKVSYDFGDSAGTPTRIAFRAEGGLLDDIIQSFFINPLPSYMSFDLTILGEKEFLYESDQPYEATYALDSIQQGNLVTFEIIKIPATIHASWGIDVGELGDLALAGFADLDMSHDVDQFALYLFGNENPIFQLENFPRKISIEAGIDIPEGTGNITIQRGIDDIREIALTLDYEDLMVTKSLELKNSFVQFLWDIDIENGQGSMSISRDSDSLVAFGTTISLYDWEFSKSTQLTNSFVELSWDVNRDERRGRLALSRDPAGGDPTIAVSIAHGEWSISNTLELKNDLIELYWNLPDQHNPHAELGVNTEGDEIFYNTLSVVDNSVEILSIGVGIAITDHFHIAWDNNDGIISNFEWSGRPVTLSSLDVAVHLPGDVFTFMGEWHVGEEGSIGLEFNKDIDVHFVDVETNHFKVLGHISFFENRPLSISWQWGELGHFTINTYNQPLGDQSSLKLLWDPSGQANYRFGFNITAPEILETYLQISWYKDPEFLIPCFWFIGDLPLNWNEWEKWLLWNYDWWEIEF